MEKPHLTIYWREYMRMKSIMKWKDFLWNPVMVVKVSCNRSQRPCNRSQRQHDCLMMNENERWQMYGLQAIERVNGKRMVWNEFAEAMRVLKLAVDRDVLEHLQQLEKYPDSTFVDSLMELHQNTENHELQCILNYLFHWRLEDKLESVAETVFFVPT